MPPWLRSGASRRLVRPRPQPRSPSASRRRDLPVGFADIASGNPGACIRTTPFTSVPLTAAIPAHRPTHVRGHCRRQMPAADRAPMPSLVPDIVGNGSPEARTRSCAAPTTRRSSRRARRCRAAASPVVRSVRCRARRCARLRRRVARIRRRLRRHRVRASGRKTSRQDRHQRVNDCADPGALADARPRALPSPDARSNAFSNDLARAGHSRQWISDSTNPVLHGANDTTSSRCARRCRAPASPVARSASMPLVIPGLARSHGNGRSRSES